MGAENYLDEGHSDQMAEPDNDNKIQVPPVAVPVDENIQKMLINSIDQFRMMECTVFNFFRLQETQLDVFSKTDDDLQPQTRLNRIKKAKFVFKI